ncbi:MAG: sulfotransferase [Leptolyngbya sp. SIO1D8]|nr:sulfotransferase [Leptolyngbya sp. SIO1D8]
MQQANPRKIIFIVGCPRSGTTLLQQMLDAHPDIAIAPETHFMQLFWGRRNQYGDLAGDKNYKQLIENITALPEFLEMELDVQDFTESAWNISRNYSAVFSLILEKFADKRQANIIGEKTPNHVLYLPEIQTFFPEACFINLVRDPRAVVNSWRSVPWSSGSVLKDAEHWRFHISAAWRKPPTGKDKIFTINYEQLVLSPEESLRSLCDFMNLEFNSAMLNYYKKGSKLVNVKREPWKKGAVKPVSQQSLTKWQSELSSKEITEIEGITWFEMNRLGYNPQTNVIRLLLISTMIAAKRKFKSLTASVKSRVLKLAKP